MLCSEYLRLRQHYEAALRRWAQVELSSNKRELFDTPARLAAEVKKCVPQTLRRPMNVGEGDKVRSFQQTRLSWEHGDSLRWKSRDADLVNRAEERPFLNLSGMDRDPSNLEARVLRDIDQIQFSGVEPTLHSIQGTCCRLTNR